jgi:hypothetical protein
VQNGSADSALDPFALPGGQRTVPETHLTDTHRGAPFLLGSLPLGAPVRFRHRAGAQPHNSTGSRQRAGRAAHLPLRIRVRPGGLLSRRPAPRGPAFAGHPEREPPTRGGEGDLLRRLFRRVGGGRPFFGRPKAGSRVPGTLVRPGGTGSNRRSDRTGVRFNGCRHEHSFGSRSVVTLSRSHALTLSFVSLSTYVWSLARRVDILARAHMFAIRSPLSHPATMRESREP